MAYTIHIFTLTWNGQEKLEKLAPTLWENVRMFGAHRVFRSFEWHIRDNGSSDDTIKAVEGFKFSKVYEVGHNRDSFAKGMNYLFEQANPDDTDLILLLNNDMIFGDERSLLNMVELLTASDVGMVGARLLYNDTNLLQHAGVIFSQRYNNLPYHYRHKEISDAAAEKNRYFQAVTAACCLLRAKDWRAVNGMDENYWWCFEDVDLCFAIRSLGKKIAYCGKTKIYHEESASLKKNPVNKMMMPQNVDRFKQKWHNKYIIDHDRYLKDTNYNLIK